MAIELAQKVCDSVACIMGAYHISNMHEHWQPYAELLCHRPAAIKVVLWLEHDLPSHPRQRSKVLASVRTKVFKQKLIWLTHQVLVCGSNSQGLPDVRVSNLPRN